MKTLEAYYAARNTLIRAESNLRSDLNAKARDPEYPFIDEVIEGSERKVLEARVAYNRAGEALTDADRATLDFEIRNG